jgi:hypothetical protein
MIMQPGIHTQLYSFQVYEFTQCPATVVRWLVHQPYRSLVLYLLYITSAGSIDACDHCDVCNFVSRFSVLAVYAGILHAGITCLKSNLG